MASSKRKEQPTTATSIEQPRPSIGAMETAKQIHEWLVQTLNDAVLLTKFTEIMRKPDDKSYSVDLSNIERYTNAEWKKIGGKALSVLKSIAVSTKEPYTRLDLPKPGKTGVINYEDSKAENETGTQAFLDACAARQALFLKVANICLEMAPLHTRVKKAKTTRGASSEIGSSRPIFRTLSPKEVAPAKVILGFSEVENKSSMATTIKRLQLLLLARLSAVCLSNGEFARAADDLIDDDDLEEDDDDDDDRNMNASAANATYKILFPPGYFDEDGPAMQQAEFRLLAYAPDCVYKPFEEEEEHRAALVGVLQRTEKWGELKGRGNKLLETLLTTVHAIPTLTLPVQEA